MSLSNSQAGGPGSSVSGASSTAGGVFVTTHWSIVRAAQDKWSARSAESLEWLCRVYWRPLYGYVRRAGKSQADAEDLTQAFFTRLLEKDYLAAAREEKGKFRSFLLTVLKRFMANEWDRQRAAKRGGAAVAVQVDGVEGEEWLAASPESSQPDLLFQRNWARTLLERAIEALRKEYILTGRAELFDHLQSCLARNESALSYDEIGRKLNLSEGAVKMAVFRLRARFRELLLEEVAQTVCSREDAEEEIRELFQAF